MKPVSFKEQTKVLQRPASMTDEECGSLPVFSDGEQFCVSRWKLSLLDKIRIIFFGKIWLGIISGETQPPVWLDCRRSIFEERPE